MTSNSTEEEGDTVVVECREPEDEATASILSEITISTAEISAWDLPTILSHQIVRVKTSRNRLVEQCSYFCGLLGGNFSLVLCSESSKPFVVIKWCRRTFLELVRFIYGSRIEITLCNFLPLLQAALYFGVELLLLECRTWFSDNFSQNAGSRQIQLEDLILIWNYGIEHGIDFISGICTSYMARNFMWAMACDSFTDVPYNLLLSCIEHPQLTVNSERNLAEALLSWIYTHIEEPKHDDCSKFDWINILKQIRVYILPLWFLMGKRRCQYFSEFAEQSIDVILSQLQQSPIVSTESQGISDLSLCRIRLTEFSKKLDLSGCPQTNAANVLFSLLPCSWSSVPREGTMPRNIDVRYFSLDPNPNFQGLLQALSYKSVVELDLSKCPKLHLSAVLELLCKSFPSLRTLKAAYHLDFKTRFLQKLMENCHLDEVDLRVDVGPIVPSQASILYSELESAPAPRMCLGLAHPPLKQSLSVMTKLTLRGRTDINDSDLRGISEWFVSLCYLDIKGCFSVTDVGISNFISKCARLRSFIASDTLFGTYSTLALCDRLPKSASFSVAHPENKYAEFSNINLQLLHIGGCKGVDEASLLRILSQANNLTDLCLRDTFLVDNSLCNFTGSSLEKLNVCNTVISAAALIYIISRNPHLKCLKARGCKGLSQQNKADDLMSLQWREEWSIELGKTCSLEQFTIGWGVSLFSLDALAPAIRYLESLTVGLGASLGEEGLVLITRLCPKLESITLLFQEVSDYAVIKLMETLRKLRALELCYCLGDLSPLCFKISVPSLKTLKLERVTPWMTNQDLTLLTQNVPNLMELSLIGCRSLDADSQQIISNGWPGLISLCLEDCGGITSRGVCSLYTCRALENLVIKHNGRGVKKNVIIDAASELPMLRNISLDWCDATDGDFDLPLFANRCYLSSVKISKCKFEKCSLVSETRAIHKETLVVVWNSTGVHRRVVKERLR